MDRGDPNAGNIKKSVLREQNEQKFYYLSFLLLILSAVFWYRGLPNSFSERLQIAKQRFTKPYLVSFTVILFAFISLGTFIFLETKVDKENSSGKQAELDAVKWEKTYKKYENYKQPRIVAVKANVDIYPKKRTYKAGAIFTMVNKTNKAIDSIFLNHNQIFLADNMHEKI